MVNRGASVATELTLALGPSFYFVLFLFPFLGTKVAFIIPASFEDISTAHGALLRGSRFRL